MSVLELELAKDRLGLTNASAATSAKLQDVIDRAEAAIAAKCGHLEPTSRTDRCRGGGTSLTLPTYPIVSVESITAVVTGETVSLVDLDVDTASGVISCGAFPATAYVVEYTAGREVCPLDLVAAVGDLVEDMWTPQRSATSRQKDSDPAAPKASTLLPAKVQQKIEPYLMAGMS